MDQRVVAAALGHHLFVTAGLDDFALLEDQDPVGADDRG